MAPRRFFEDGEMCGKYVILGILGWGGYAQVYRAQNEVGEVVALKVLEVRHARDRRAAERLFKEARTLRELGHVNVVGFIEWGFHNEDEYVYLAMELVPGKTLRALSGVRSYLTMERIVDLGRQLCSALSAVHDQGLVHRDVKMENIMVTPSHVLKLLDFGIVRDEVGIGTTNTVGTMRSMSPAQLRHPNKPVPGWDLWPVALILYELLATYPFIVPDEENPSLANLVLRITTWPVTPLGDLVPGCPPALADAVMKGLEKNPEDGWSSAREFEAALASILKELQPADTPEQLATMAAIRQSMAGDDVRSDEAEQHAKAALAAAPSESLGHQATEPQVLGVQPSDAAPKSEGPGGTVVMQETPREALEYARKKRAAAEESALLISARSSAGPDGGASASITAHQLLDGLRLMAVGDTEGLTALIGSGRLDELCMVVLKLAEAHPDALLIHGRLDREQVRKAIGYAAARCDQPAPEPRVVDAASYAAGAVTDVVDLEALLGPQVPTGPLPATGGTEATGQRAVSRSAASKLAQRAAAAPEQRSPKESRRNLLVYAGLSVVVFSIVFLVMWLR